MAAKLAAGLAIGVTGLVLWSFLSTWPASIEQPAPDIPETVNAALELVHHQRYVTTLYGSPQPPRYPPGGSLALVPFVVLGGPSPVTFQRAARVKAGFYLVASVVAAWVLGGPLAAVLVAIVVGLSPFARTEASLLTVDAFTAGLTVVIATLLARPSRGTVLAAGAIAGALVGVRYQMLVVLVAFLLALPRRFWWPAILGAAPWLLLLAVYHWSTFGHVFVTGYATVNEDGPFRLWYLFTPFDRGGLDGPWLIRDHFSGGLLRWAVCPCPPLHEPEASLINLWFYPVVLLGLFWIYAPPFVSLLGLVELRRRWREPVAQFTILLTAGTLALFSVYFYQGARFMAGPATLLLVWSATAAAAWLELVAARIAPRLAAVTRAVADPGVAPRVQGFSSFP